MIEWIIQNNLLHCKISWCQTLIQILSWFPQFIVIILLLLQLCELWCLNLVFLILFQHMVMSFRVSELQVLLGYAGRNKSGRKQELLQRALLLVQKGCSTPVQIKIRELYRYVLYLNTFSSFELLQSKRANPPLKSQILHTKLSEVSLSQQTTKLS